MLGAQITDAPATIKASQRGKGRCLFGPQQGDNQRFIEKGIRSFKEVGEIGPSLGNWKEINTDQEMEI